ncbi:hypothetical protein FP2506_11367 [Fulvimarina pelagi HTCC2506]|uniref:Uncharacterized protein n=1 Tax=Fulvimarina pelagi HTCC2506 TaxID=314231 RepID=Q0FZ06_9HYPH|nr:hypothetical protein [Fulvimarina pelagi]EAU40152.1 hypothetical protein FP2506_11367 [Fulvimarina pelagi HTCC2506]
MPVLDQTPEGVPLPHPDNSPRSVDVGRIRDALILLSQREGTVGTRIATAVDTAIAELKAGAPAAYDTLIEVADKLADQDDVIASLFTAIGDKAAASALAAHLADTNDPHRIASAIRDGVPASFDTLNKLHNAKMSKSQNLNDVSDKAVARANLDLDGLKVIDAGRVALNGNSTSTNTAYAAHATEPFYIDSEEGDFLEVTFSCNLYVDVNGAIRDDGGSAIVLKVFDGTDYVIPVNGMHSTVLHSNPGSSTDQALRGIAYLSAFLDASYKRPSEPTRWYLRPYFYATYSGNVASVNGASAIYRVYKDLRGA